MKLEDFESPNDTSRLAFDDEWSKILEKASHLVANKDVREASISQSIPKLKEEDESKQKVENP